MDNGSIDEMLKTCRRLMYGVMFDDFSGEMSKDGETEEFRILFRKGEVIVGCGGGQSLVITDVDTDRGYGSCGRGTTFLIAIADWRSRLAKGAQKKMAEHESFRRFVEERGLLR
jgi:hypothetical protein